MRPKWYAPRLIKWHVLMAVIVSGCCYAAWWQFHRAAGGNALSYLYSIEWPAFAVISVIGWWQLIREPQEEFEQRQEDRRQLSLPKPVAYDQDILRRELAAHPELVHSFPELAKAFPELAAELPAGEAPEAAGKGGLPVVTTAALSGEEVEDAPSQQAAAYNQVLSSLAAQGKPKTWRNPRGRADT